MPSKSLVIGTRVDRAKRGHFCQANSRHRIERGEIRLKVRNGQGWDHYCRNCAEAIIQQDLEKLTQLQALNPTEEYA